MKSTNSRGRRASLVGRAAPLVASALVSGLMATAATAQSARNTVGGYELDVPAGKSQVL